MAKYKSGKLTETEEYVILGMSISGKSEKEIKTLLGRGPKSKIVSNYINSLYSVLDTNTLYTDIINDGIAHITDSGVSENIATNLVKEGLDEMLKDGIKPNSGSEIVEKIQKKIPAGAFQSQPSQNGTRRITVSTETSSMQADENIVHTNSSNVVNTFRPKDGTYNEGILSSQRKNI